MFKSIFSFFLSLQRMKQCRVVCKKTVKKRLFGKKEIGKKLLPCLADMKGRVRMGFNYCTFTLSLSCAECATCFLPLSLFIHLTVCPSLCLFHSSFLSVCLFVHMSVFPSVSLFICLFVFFFVSLLSFLSICVFICLFVFCLCVLLSIFILPIQSVHTWLSNTIE